MRLTQIACDIHDCDARWPDQPEPRLDRRDARRDGWEGDGEQDLCPQHNERAAIVNEVRRLAHAGLNDTEIGARIRHSRNFVWELRRRHGIPGQPPGRPGVFRRPVRQPAARV